MKKSILYTLAIIVAAAFFTSCGNKYEGTYEGVLPCADCEGIRTELKLNKDTYTLKMTYLGMNSDNIFESTGNYTWDSGTNIITLQNEMTPNRYQLGDNVLYHLDENGNRIMGYNADNYILKKK